MSKWPKRRQDRRLLLANNRRRRRRWRRGRRGKRTEQQLLPRVWHGLLKRKRLFTMRNKLVLRWLVCKRSCQQTNNNNNNSTTTIREPSQRLWLKL